MYNTRVREWFSPTICLTHNCNLDCIYCYQNHCDNKEMSYETAISVINYIFENIPADSGGVQIEFIGGEPLLKFTLIKQIYEYVKSKKLTKPYVFFASTNGTVLSEEMKHWFSDRKACFVLGLSLDGTRETHNINRCNSYDKIDFDFFLKNWPQQSVKMTLSEFSIGSLADNIISIHNKGFLNIAGVNLAEGDFDWSDEKYVIAIAEQLSRIVDFYVVNDEITPNQMLSPNLAICEAKEVASKKWCGIGTGSLFFDVDGKIYPCAYVTPMTFSEHELADIQKVDFYEEDNFVDTECYEHCYIYPICPSCAAACFLKNKTFSKRDKSKCRIQKLVALFAADLVAKKLVNNPDLIEEKHVYDTIEAIKNIKRQFISDYPLILEQQV